MSYNKLKIRNSKTLKSLVLHFANKTVVKFIILKMKKNMQYYKHTLTKLYL
jgi:hypothetical protein